MREKTELLSFLWESLSLSFLCKRGEAVTVNLLPIWEGLSLSFLCERGDSVTLLPMGGSVTLLLLPQRNGMTLASANPLTMVFIKPYVDPLVALSWLI